MAGDLSPDSVWELVCSLILVTSMSGLRPRASLSPKDEFRDSLLFCATTFLRPAVVALFWELVVAMVTSDKGSADPMDL